MCISHLYHDSVDEEIWAESNLNRRLMMDGRWRRLAAFSSMLLRVAVGASFLSAIADRFGLWGAYGQPNVAWGNYARFVHYTAELNWFLPAAMISVLAIIATAAETLFCLLLVLGLKTQATEPAINRYRSLSSPFLLDELRSRGKLLEISDRSELLRDRTFTANEFLAHERVKEMRSTSAFKSLLHRIIRFGLAAFARILARLT